jgi:hypothetical protein
MKRLILLFTLTLLMLGESYSQEYLGLFAGGDGGANGFGISYEVGPINFELKTSAGLTAPPAPLSVTAAYSNQQYININIADTDNFSGIHDAMLFGSMSNNLNKILELEDQYVRYRNVASPDPTYYSALPGGPTMSTSEHHAFEQYVSVEGLDLAGAPTSGTYYMGDITYTFSEVVENPILHVTGLGGFFSSDINGTQLFSVRYRLVTGSGATGLNKLSGTSRLDVIGNDISNNYSQDAFDTPPTENDPNNNGGSAANDAGTGSIEVTGAFQSVTFEVWMDGKVSDVAWTTREVDGPTQQKYSGDRFNTSWSLSPESILPVELLSFTAEKSGSTSLLNWSTAAEIDFDHFEVERSADGRTFETIGVVDAKGSNSVYSFVDRLPIIGLNYYRLKMLDIDGEFEYSVVRTVTFDKDLRGIKIYPNPTTDKVYLERVPEGSEISVLAIDGRLIRKFQIESTVRQEVSLKGNEAGVYLIEISNKGVTNHHPIILVK